MIGIIPNLEDHENQRIHTTLQLDDGTTKDVFILLRYTKATDHWWITIQSGDGQDIVRGIPLLQGESFPSANLLRQFEYLNLGTLFSFCSSAEETGDPGKDNLGNELAFHLAWRSDYA